MPLLRARTSKPRSRVRAASAQPRATVIAVAQWDPVIAALHAAADGNTAAAAAAENFLTALESQLGRAALATALRRIMTRDLDAVSLTENLAESDAAIVERALDALEGRDRDTSRPVAGGTDRRVPARSRHGVPRRA